MRVELTNNKGLIIKIQMMMTMKKVRSLAIQEGAQSNDVTKSTFKHSLVTLLKVPLAYPNILIKSHKKSKLSNRSCKIMTISQKVGLRSVDLNHLQKKAMTTKTMMAIKMKMRHSETITTMVIIHKGKT